MTTTALTGSEKQVAWATTIRAAAMQNIADALPHIQQHMTEQYEWDAEKVAAEMAVLQEVVAKAQINTAASFWIDNRVLSSSANYNSVWHWLSGQVAEAARLAYRAKIKASRA